MDRKQLTNRFYSCDTLESESLLTRMPEENDSILIQAASRGDEHAFAELVKRYHAVVWSTVHRTLGSFNDAEDVVQEIFLRVLVSLKRFDFRYPFGPWILRIAGNYCIDQLHITSEQETQLREILEDSRRRINDCRAELQQNMDDIRADTNACFTAVLDQDQKSIFESLIKDTEPQRGGSRQSRSRKTTGH